MKPWLWFRGLAVVFALFTLGHTVGTLQRLTSTAQENDVVAAMQGSRFPVMGSLRSYWDFYRGFSITISVDLAILAIIAWQVAAISRRSPRDAVPLAATLVVACAANAIIAWQYFFAGPIVTSFVATACAVVALALLRRDAQVPAGSFASTRATA